uniref:alpha-L-fucosidase n=1 Tax=Prevotella sp. GTC17253 TaxID=3236793 RepID=A0AB33ISG5_9BACT
MLKHLLLSALCAVVSLQASAQGDVYERSKTYEWPTDQLVINKLHQWQDQKFGVLFHWGIYSVPGMVESWAICDEDWVTRDTTMTYQQYKDWYWGLADKFNPVKFNPDQWASVMDDAGMKYMIFTTKHHDGFCMFDSKYTDYSIAHHAFKDNPKRDVLKYVLEAFRKKDFMIGTYFSKPDWHSQYYWWDVYPQKARNVNYDIKKWPWRWNQFKQYTYNQMNEILSRYGKVDILWMDGGWVCKENNQDIDMPRIAEMARRNQPGLIMVDRTIHGPYENYQTPERTIPETQLNFPWESCITLTNDWGWVPRPTWKSPMKVVNILTEIVAKGGNLVLGVGPTPEGLIQPEAAERLHKIGNWMRVNGKAIYNTVTTPNYHDGNVWFTANKDGRTLYAIYTLADGETLPSQIHWKGNLPKGKVVLLSNGKALKTKVKDGEVTVTLPKGMKQESFAMTFRLS